MLRISLHCLLQEVASSQRITGPQLLQAKRVQPSSLQVRWAPRSCRELFRCWHFSHAELVAELCASPRYQIVKVAQITLIGHHCDGLASHCILQTQVNTYLIASRSSPTENPPNA